MDLLIYYNTCLPTSRHIVQGHELHIVLSGVRTFDFIHYFGTRYTTLCLLASPTVVWLYAIDLMKLPLLR